MMEIPMDVVLVNYNFKPTWLEDSAMKSLTIFDRSDDDSLEYLKTFAGTSFTALEVGKKNPRTVYGFDRSDKVKIMKTENIGNVDYDKLTYLVENYDNLPDIFLWGKSNLFKYVSKEEFERVKDESVFTPLLTQYHKTYSDRLGPVCYYEDGMYYERNNSWYVQDHARRFQTYDEFAKYLNLPSPPYLPFPPGGNFILTRERVHRYARDFYDKMRNTLDYCQLPAEAHMCERTYYSLWR